MDGYTLIITEKPDTANRIATALDAYEKPKKIFNKGIPYYQAYRNGDLIVVPALGHLYTVAAKNKTSHGYPIFDYQWVPKYMVERGASKIRVWLKVIEQLAQNAETFVNACDFDVEGSIIGYCILKYACKNKQDIAKRMKYSTLTTEELQESYAHLLPNIDFAQVEAGLTRHEVDWLFGINLSRALTLAAKKASGQYATLSTGRVQGPTLKFLEKREKTIQCFVPTPYWRINAKIVVDDAVFEVEYEKTIDKKAQAEAILEACKTRQGLVSDISCEEFSQKPPFPFDLGALQSEAYRLFKYTPMRTSTIAQRLYVDALISYPRTSSQKLPASISYQTILKKLSKTPLYSKQTTELLKKPTLKPIEGTKFDPAHPAIYPTGNLPQKPLDTPHRNIFDLVVKRFFAVFGESAVCQRVNVSVSVSGHLFRLCGVRTLFAGWLRFYEPYAHLEDSVLPPVKVGQCVFVKRVVLHDEFTKPPPRYNPRSLLLKMEKEEIGTKATRAATIQTLHDRKYLAGSSSIYVSDLGFEVIEVLSQYCPTVISPQLTRQLEEKMSAIQQGQQTKENVLRSALSVLEPVLAELKEKEAEVGKHLSQALRKAQWEQKTVGDCPKCQGKLVVLRSKKSGKRFVGCTSFFMGKCSVSYPLPQKGTIKAYGSCKKCGAPAINVWFGGRKPWRLCVNPSCPSKGESNIEV